MDTEESRISSHLNELEGIESINVWSQDQAVLEGQALTEIEIFSKAKEEGELSEHESDSLPKSSSDFNTLDINKYIKQQEEFKRKLDNKRASSVSEKSRVVASKIESNMRKRKRRKENNARNRIKIEEKINNNRDEEKSGSEYFPSDLEGNDSDYTPGDTPITTKKRKRKSSDSITMASSNDDGDLKLYKGRLNEYYKSIERDLLSLEESMDNEEVEVYTGFKVIGKIWNNLYSYQQDAVEWLYELHVKSTGGLLGDEMGLGKTVQVWLELFHLINQKGFLRYGCVGQNNSNTSSLYTGLGPTIIVCPTTVLHQWVQHFHEWAPEFRIAVLHQSGSYTGDKLALITEIFNDKGILVTSYQGILKYKSYLVVLDWHYIILDEGHKIRNPTAKVSIAVKQFKTPHRLMLTGSPMQNNLQELWSLFDFVFPGLLGSLQVFVQHFAMPIMHGGYSNATPIQETTALLMATTLKNLITPYLLRRSKDEVRADIRLPQKTEQVLFCSLTDEQYDLYKGFLLSEHVSSLLGKGGRNWFSENYMRSNVLVAITTLRKICNHSDLYLKDADEQVRDDSAIEESFGYYKRSGKMIVVSALLKIWKKQKHRVLLFTQGRAMVSILENFLQQQGYKYLKMDGSTNIKSRQTVIRTFNEDASYDVFLLTTRVGGLGVNLTGANRVIIYDPDWNPATDTQARERAWRIGQERQVTIYRLVSAGTIEEKMYQRQVWKQLLSNKVLLDPRTQKFFKTSDLHDLFSIQDRESTANPETANIFKNSRISMQERLKEKKAQSKRKKETKNTEPINFSGDKIEEMKKRAQEISKSIGKNSAESSKGSKKTTVDLELGMEREVKKQERDFMKTLSPFELRKYNKKKLLPNDDSMMNKMDDLETEASFSKVLELSEKTSSIYHKVKEEKLNVDKAVETYDSLTAVIKKKCDKKKSDRGKGGGKIDRSGVIDGEKIEFLVKKEAKPRKDPDKHKTMSEKQDQYVLEKLFSRKGVHTALEHDKIIDSKQKVPANRCQIQYEAQATTDLALLALMKSRTNISRF